MNMHVATPSIAPAAASAPPRNHVGSTGKTWRRRLWSDEEIGTLKRCYPSMGAKGCLAMLPGRSISSIYNRAGELGLVSPLTVKARPRTRWTSSPQMDAVIIRIMQQKPTRGMVERLAKTLARPEWWVSKRAARLGLVTPRFKQAPWADDELELAVSNAHKQPETIKRILAGRGFNRSATAILVKLKKHGCGTGKNADFDHYTATALSVLFGVDSKTVTRWIVNGWLKGKRRGTGRTQAQGGDEWSIHRRAVKAFIIDNVAVIDFRKLDKHWLVEVLTERGVQ